MEKLHKVTFILLLVGGLNWLLWGAFGLEIGQLFGSMSAPASRIIYVLVGLSAIYEIVEHKKACRKCSTGGAM